jgi:hypothetical protein
MHPHHRTAAGHRLRRLAGSAAAVTLTALTIGLVPATGAHAADTSVTVDFATAGGAPTYHGSGTLYGMTPDGSLPPDHFYKDIKWHFERAGGAQLNSGGYATSLADYQTRWNATLAQYKRTVALGGTFILLPHDLWGADSTTSQPFPGDNGDWTTFDTFVNQLFSDVKANNMTVEWDLWNEPNGQGFWPRPETQYLQMWSRFYTDVRAAFPSQLIVGPSYSQNPAANSWWSAYLGHIKADNTIPDIWSWHAEAGDPVADAQAMDSLLSANGLTNHRPYQINEYATLAQQNPGGGAWYLSRLERAGADGLRGNWGSKLALHDYEANLLTKSGSQYLPKGEWFTYRFYGSQTGTIVNVIPGTNTDGFATKDNTAGNAKILLGSNGNTGTVTVNLTGLNTTSVVANNQVRAILQRMPYNNGAATPGPVTVTDQLLTVNGNAASLTVPWTDARDGYTITLLPPSNATFSTVAVVQHSGQCLDDTNLSTAAGTQYQQYYCEGGYQQMLDFKPVSGRANTYTITDEDSGLCLDVSGASTADGAAVIQWTCNGHTNQEFTLNPVTALGNSQDFQLVAVHSGKCVDVTGVSTAPGTLVHQWTCDPASTLSTKKNQIWRLLGKG